jgi:type IV secretion system protein VirB3
MDDNGLEIPLYQSLTQPILMGGVPRTFAILLWMFVMILSIPLHLFYIGIPFGIFTHSLAAWLTKRDPHFFEVLVRHLRQPHFWN